MIITVDPSQSEDIAAFAMVKQYRMQALNVTLNGGTGVSAWQAVQGGEGYTQTVVTPVTGIELVYEDPNAIVSYTVENDDTSNYDAASDAGIILSSIEPTTNAWTYTCVFYADSVPVSSVDIDLLVYGNIARGTEQQGSPATAEEITAQVLAGLETRVLALENEMPDKADVATTYSKTETDTLLATKASTSTVQTLDTRVGALETGLADTYNKSQTDTLLAGKADTATTYTKTETDTLLAGYVTLNTAQTITAVKTLTQENGLRRITTYARGSGGQATWKLVEVDKDGNNLVMVDLRDDGTSRGVHLRAFDNNGNNYTALATNTSVADGTSFVQVVTRGYNPAYTSDVATIGTLDAYSPMVRTSGSQTIGGEKTFSNTMIITAYESLKFNAISGNAPSMAGNTAASQRVLDQYTSYKDGGEWMVRNTIYQAANSKNYSRLLYLRRYDNNNNILQTLFTFSIDANGKGHISVTDSDGTSHTVV